MLEIAEGDREGGGYLADDSNEFAFPIQTLALLCLWMHGDWIEWSSQSRDWLIEQDWEFGDWHVGFHGVETVVQSQAADGLHIFSVW